MACAKAADEVKAENIRIWDMRKVSGLTDYMIVCSGSSMPQLRAILNEVSQRVEEEHGVKAIHREGKVDARWVVLDYIDVMVHVMHQELRDYYGLEELWKDAKEIPAGDERLYVERGGEWVLDAENDGLKGAGVLP